MQKGVLLEIVKQNQFTSHFSFDRVTEENANLVLPVIFVGVAGTIAFGIWLWHCQGYSISTGWIWASLALWVAANALGGIGGQHQERARKMAEQLAAQGDTSTAELKAILADRKGNAVSWAAGLATLLILVLMIWKP